MPGLKESTTIRDFAIVIGACVAVLGAHLYFPAHVGEEAAVAAGGMMTASVWAIYKRATHDGRNERRARRRAFAPKTRRRS